MASILTEPSSHPPASAAPLPGMTASHKPPDSHVLLQVSTQMSSCQETSFISAQLIHNRGEPIRSQKQAQKYVNEEMFYRPYILSFISSCHTCTGHALLAVDLKQTVIHLMLKILQAGLQQYVNCELPDVQAGFRKGRGTRDQIASICWTIKRARVPEKHLFLLYGLCQRL